MNYSIDWDGPGERDQVEDIMANVHFSASGTEDHIVKLLRGSDISDKVKMIIEDQMLSKPGHNWAVAITANEGATSQSIALNIAWFQLVPETTPPTAVPTAERDDGR
mgnify:CR=1 FL=1